jgi:flagellar capping protein FliD
MNMSPVSILLSLANFRSQALGSLTGSSAGAKDENSWSSIFQGIASDSASAAPLAVPTKAGEVQGLSSTGRNLGLFDPESAYKMMSVINNNDVSYKAQFSELSEMKSYVSQMQDAGQGLGSISESTSDEDITSQLQNFVGQYNDWVQRFNPDMQTGGAMADAQAAQISRYELDQSIKNPFNGARDGVHGLAGLGIVIDPSTKLASLDTSRLNSLLATNRKGAVDTVQEFSANFAKSAGLLNSAGNFIPNRLNNLDKVIHYFADHKSALQQEFDTGDAAKPSGLIAQALAAYKQNYGL